MAAIWNLIKNIGKPISNVINNIVQSLDSNGEGREEMARKYRTRGYNYEVLPLAMKANIFTTPLDEMDTEEKEVMSTIYAIERVRDFNTLQNEIALLGYDDHMETIAQSYKLTINPGVSVVQSHFCSPIMNLGAKLQSYAERFRAFRVLSIQLDISFQNQNYSTQTIAYDVLVTKENQREMQTDMYNFMQGNAPYATGHRVSYFKSKIDETKPEIPPNAELGSLGTYMNILSRIKSLPTSRDYSQLEAGNLTINEPPYVLVGMRPDIASSPEIHQGMKYFQTGYVMDFFKKFNYSSTDPNSYINIEEMPVFGKFHYAISNNYSEPIDMITTLRYKFTFKRTINNSTYTTIVNDPNTLEKEFDTSSPEFEEMNSEMKKLLFS